MSNTYIDSDGNNCNIQQMIQREPEWAASRIKEGEKAIKEMAAKDRFIIKMLGAPKQGDW